MNINQRFNIGLTFTLQRGKQAKRNCEITDIFKTYNSNGMLVDLAYILTYSFMGQAITERVPDATIARALSVEGRLVDCLNELN